MKQRKGFQGVVIGPLSGVSQLNNSKTTRAKITKKTKKYRRLKNIDFASIVTFKHLGSQNAINRYVVDKWLNQTI